MKYLITKAYTNSEWDSVSFATIELTPWHLKLIKKSRRSVSKIKSDGDSFNFIEYSGDMAEFYADEGELPEGITIKEGFQMAVALSLEDIERLTPPEQVVKYGRIRVYTYGVQYVGYGKHTDEEFWTEIIPFGKILIHEKS